MKLPDLPLPGFGFAKNDDPSSLEEMQFSAISDANVERAFQAEELPIMETFENEYDLKGKTITPMEDKEHGHYFSRRDILMSNLSKYEPGVMIMFQNQIGLAHSLGWKKLAAEEGRLLEMIVISRGAVDSRTFKGVLTHQANINRTFSQPGQNQFRGP